MNTLGPSLVANKYYNENNLDDVFYVDNIGPNEAVDVVPYRIY